MKLTREFNQFDDAMDKIISADPKTVKDAIEV